MAIRAENSVPTTAKRRLFPALPGRRNFGRWVPLAVGIAALLLITATIYWVTGTEAPPRYTTVPTGRGSVTRAVTATGTVNPVLTIIVGSYVSGTIKRFIAITTRR